MSTQAKQEAAYVSLMKDLKDLDFTGRFVPSNLTLIGDCSFPLAMNSHGHVLMAASCYGSGRIVVLSHENYLTALTTLVENALIWLRGDRAENKSVGIHNNVQKVSQNLSTSLFQTQIVGSFRHGLGVGVYVTDAYSVGPDQKDLVAFLKAGGGVLIAGQAWSWAAHHPKENALLQFMGNKLSGMAGVYFSEHEAIAEHISVSPEIPSSWKAMVLGKDFTDDLKLLLQGISEINFINGVVASEILAHGPLAFPIGTTKDGRAFLAGAYYGQGRVVAITNEGLLKCGSLASLWNNAVRWLDGGRKGVVGVTPELYNHFDHLHNKEFVCENTGLRKDLSVFVCTVYHSDIAEIQEFVAEGGGLLIGGNIWAWAQGHLGQNLADFTGNKILTNMGLSLVNGTIGDGSYKTPDPSQATKDTYYFRHILHRFAGHCIHGDALSKQEEAYLSKLGGDCSKYLRMKIDDNSHKQVLSTMTDIIKTGMPQVSESCPVKTPTDHLLLHVGSELYKFHPHLDELLPYLIKNEPLLPVVKNHRIKVDVDTAGGEEWISTGLYLSRGMKTNMSIPAEIINKGWKVQIGCHTHRIKARVLKRAPCVYEQFSITSDTVQVHNLWGGLIYLVAPPKTQVKGLEVTVEMAVSAPYYKSGVTTFVDWLMMRKSPVPWAELEFENIICTVPTKNIQHLDSPHKLATHWDTIMRSIADLAAIPHKFPRKERFLTDVQIYYGLMHGGYPIMANNAQAHELVNTEYVKTHNLWVVTHELGRNQQRDCWEFPPHTTECTCNLWAVYIHEEVLKINRAKAHPNLTLASRKRRTEQYVKGGRNLNNWSMWVALETYLQLQDEFGWDAFKRVFAAYHEMSNFPKDNKGKMNLYAVTFSQTVKMNLCGFFMSWGWPIEKDTEDKLSSLPPWTDHPMAHYD